MGGSQVGIIAGMEMVERPLVYKRAIEMFAGPTPPAWPFSRARHHRPLCAPVCLRARPHVLTSLGATAIRGEVGDNADIA